MRTVHVSLILILFLAVLAFPARAAEEKHPLQVLKATFSTSASSASRSVQGICSIWLKNLSDVAVDGVQVTVKLREGSRTIRTLEKDLGTLESGKKSFLDFKFEEYSERTLKPQIWITYNGAKGPVTFEAEPPVG